MNVFLAGEGRHELGGWFRQKEYRGGDPERGLIEALLAKAVPGRFAIKGAVQWKGIRKLRAREPREAETHNVLGAARMASEAGCDVLAFTRDRDRDVQRSLTITEGIELVTDVQVIGGVAIEEIESWVLSCAGVSRAESFGDPKTEASSRLGATHLESLVAWVDAADIDRLPPDARSLRAWLARAQAVAKLPA